MPPTPKQLPADQDAACNRTPKWHSTGRWANTLGRGKQTVTAIAGYTIEPDHRESRSHSVPTRRRPFLSNAYVKLAQRVLAETKSPLSARQILAIGHKKGLVPDHLYGKTPHKTLNARLAEHILTYKHDSLFYRVGPAVYYLTSLAQEPTLPKKWKAIYQGPRRRKIIRNERVLVAPRNSLAALSDSIMFQMTSEDTLHTIENSCFFMDRRAAEKDKSVKQFVTYTIIHYDRFVLTYRRGLYSTADQDVFGARSIGFGGHVNDSDFDLFCRGEKGLLNNACRELFEELYIDDLNIDDPAFTTRTKLLGFLNVDDTPNAKQHFAVVVAHRRLSKKTPQKGELSINELQWLDLTSPVNDTSDFERWSQILLEKLYSGDLRLN